MSWSFQWRFSPLAVACNELTNSLRRTLAELSKQRSPVALRTASLSHNVRSSFTTVRFDLHHAMSGLEHFDRQFRRRNVDTGLLFRSSAGSEAVVCWACCLLCVWHVNGFGKISSHRPNSVY
jgi:hypothetical protein